MTDNANPVTGNEKKEQGAEQTPANSPATPETQGQEQDKPETGTPEQEAPATETSEK